MSDWPIYARNPIERVAAHEAGHAVVAWYSRTVMRVMDVRLGGPRIGVFGLTVSAQRLDSPLAYWEAVTISMAGMAGERFGLRTESVSGSENDLVTACSLAARSVDTYGPLPSPFPDPGKRAVLPFVITIDGGADPCIADMIATAYQEAIRSISAHRPQFMRLVGELVCRRRVRDRQLGRMFGARPWASDQE